MESSERMRFAALGPLAAFALALCACGPIESSFDQSNSGIGLNSRPVRQTMPPPGFKPDLITPDGISVQTNGQYKTEAERKAAAAAINKYWADLEKCAATALGAGDAVDAMREFPGHLSIEIANNWKVVEGPTTHRKTQAFPSLAHPGSWSMGLGKPDDVYILVVPELNGLGPQMVAELDWWLKRDTATPPIELSKECPALPCHRFYYDNAPSQAWNECVD
jgi:hypothetical protein